MRDKINVDAFCRIVNDALLNKMAVTTVAKNFGVFKTTLSSDLLMMKHSSTASIYDKQ